MSKILFFLGKGGVGKSTVSALTSLEAASKGKSVVLVSLDPAHNLSDIFNKKLGSRVKKIEENLLAKEVDEKKLVKEYLKDLEHKLSGAYSYQSAFNLLGYFDIIRHSPGIEEYSLLKAFIDITRKYKEKDYIIFDMPPTALTIKFFRLPTISLMWLEKLKDLREKIIKKKELITRIRIGTKEFERDKVLKKINESIKEYSAVKAIFSDTAGTKLNLVINPEKLSFGESLNIERDLEEINCLPAHIIINKCQSDEVIKEIKKSFKADNISTIPLSKQPPIGIKNLKSLLNESCYDFDIPEEQL